MTEQKINRPWLAMAVLGLAQFIITLDNSIVTIALPSAQAVLGLAAHYDLGLFPHKLLPSDACSSLRVGF